VITSFKECSLSASFKSAIARSLLKKPGLNKDVMKNYRPVSNLPFVSKVLEKVVESRLENHLTSNHFMSVFRRLTGHVIPQRQPYCVYIMTFP
jgi:hypothetical protein